MVQFLKVIFNGFFLTCRIWSDRFLSLSVLLGLLIFGPGPSSGEAFVSPLQDRPAPELTSTTWINSNPLKLQDLRGKVVLLEFWTYG